MFKSKKSTYVAAGMLSLGLIGAVPVLAATDHDNSKKDIRENAAEHFNKKRHHHSGHGYKLDPAIIKAKAKMLGISTSGKETEEISREVRETELKKRAKENNVTIDGKSFREISREIIQAELKKEAQKLGVSIDDKNFRQLAEDVRTATMKSEAKKLNIKTEGKEIRVLAKEVREAKISKKAKELGISSSNKETHEIVQEIRRKQILSLADKLDITAKNKTLEEIVREMAVKHPDELEKLDLFQEKNRNFFHMKGFEKYGNNDHKLRGGPAGETLSDEGAFSEAGI
ncbi:hypothetical protein ACFQPF_01155 [Fictibacillus iocasae]|uniref:Transporter n=1 Tax=Fictibacillus iocasae TaxID=2715437 RepID=A0ABW2NHX4_9BACL